MPSKLAKHTFAFNFWAYLFSESLAWILIMILNVKEVWQWKALSIDSFSCRFQISVKTLIWAVWNLWCSKDPCEVQGKARPARSKLLKLKLMTMEAQDGSTTAQPELPIFSVLVIFVLVRVCVCFDIQGLRQKGPHWWEYRVISRNCVNVWCYCSSTTKEKLLEMV